MRVTACRLCGQGPLAEVMDFGRQALANAYLASPAEIDSEPTFPMALCLCERCGFLQINEEVDPVVLFRNYLYVSGVSEAIQRHGAHLVELVDRFAAPADGAGASPLLVEAASNDGTILSVFKTRGWRVLGVDPAENVAAMANARGIETMPAFFGREAAARAVGHAGKADVVLARHVIAHVAALHDFVDGLAEVLDDRGVAVVECSHALPFFRGLEYDQVYHEHLGFFSVAAMRRLFEMHGLDLYTVVPVEMHGGSIVAFGQKAGGRRQPDGSVDRMATEEAAVGLGTTQAWREFAQRAHAQRDSLTRELRGLKASGRSIAAYGAAAKGQVMLQYCGIGRDVIDFVVDRSDLKQGRLTPGTHIPIVGPDELVRRQPDVVLLCSWNYADEVLRQQQAYLARGGRFLHPLPDPHYLPA